MERQLEVSLWMENRIKECPLTLQIPPKREGVLALHIWGCGPHKCTSQSSHYSLMKTHRGQCIQSPASWQP